MNEQIERRYKSLIQRHEGLKKVLVQKDKELLKLRKEVHSQRFFDEQPRADLITNIKNYLESQLLIDLSTRTRQQPYIKGRCMLYWFAKRYTDLTLIQIGRLSGNVDHSTVIHGLAICQDYIEQNKTFAKDLKRFDDYIMNNIISPKTETIESIEIEIQQLNERLERLRK